MSEDRSVPHEGTTGTLELARYPGGATETEMREVIQRIWTLADAAVVGWFLPRASE